MGQQVRTPLVGTEAVPASVPFPCHPHLPGTAGLFGTTLSGLQALPSSSVPWSTPPKRSAAQGPEPLVSSTCPNWEATVPDHAEGGVAAKGTGEAQNACGLAEHNPQGSGKGVLSLGNTLHDQTDV